MFNIFMFAAPFLLILSFLFTQLSHPLAMGLTLLIQTVLISLSVGLYNFSFWFSYILFLVFLGGMLVLFIYVSSLASNESFSFSTSSFLLSTILVMMMMTLMSLIDPFVLSQIPLALPTSSLDFSYSTPLMINWIYNSPSMMFTLFIVSYLLLMLIVVVKIVNLFKGPLRLFY
uniref:NADH-ubiquinone oxidoreductase chain 6 n=1 Tax=Metaplax longipes TaxID=1550546 RepID=A0A411EZ19_9EUCA|nr:NADH dehydrogenase subunit 6 [Metaplax longipes]QBA83260.1 NADH dehydrogenase subunit 6 [Metaplax longipes]